MHSIGRRTLCSGIIPALAFLSVPALATPAISGSPIRTIVQQALEVYRVSNDPCRELTDQEAYDLSGQFSNHLDALNDMRATTWEELAAKASLIRSYLPPYLHACDADEDSPEICLLFSLIDDVIAFDKEPVA